MDAALSRLLGHINARLTSDLARATCPGDSWAQVGAIVTNTGVVLSERGEPAAIWERRKGESGLAYSAFVIYREMPLPRSISKVARQLKRGTRMLEEWSRRYAWVERADAYLDHVDRISREAVETDIIQRRREANAQLFDTGQKIHDLAMLRVTGRTATKKGEFVSPLHPSDLDAQDVARLLDLAARFTRTALGLPTDVTGSIQVNLVDVEKMLASFLEAAERRMEPDEFALLVRDVNAMVQETLGT